MAKASCGNCNFWLDRSQMFCSRLTHHYYCNDIEGCERRIRNELTNEEIVSFCRRALHAMKG